MGPQREQWADRGKEVPYLLFPCAPPMDAPLPMPALCTSRVPHGSFPPFSAVPSLPCLVTEAEGVEGSCPCTMCAYERQSRNLLEIGINLIDIEWQMFRYKTKIEKSYDGEISIILSKFYA